MSKKVFTMLKNFSFRIAGDVIAKLLSLVTVPIIARALKPEAFGVWDLVQIILNYTLIFVNFGYIEYGLREVAKSDKPTQIVNRIFNARLTLAIASILISAIVVFIIYHDNLRLAFAVFIGYGIIIANAINTDFFYFGKRNLALPTMTHLGGQIVFVAGVALFVNKPESLFILVLFYSLYYLVNSSILLFVYLQKNTIQIKISFKEAFAVMKMTFHL